MIFILLFFQKKLHTIIKKSIKLKLIAKHQKFFTNSTNADEQGGAVRGAVCDVTVVNLQYSVAHPEVAAHLWVHFSLHKLQYVHPDQVLARCYLQ